MPVFKSLVMQVPDIETYCRISMNKGLPDRDYDGIFQQLKSTKRLQTEKLRTIPVMIIAVPEIVSVHLYTAESVFFGIWLPHLLLIKF